MSKVIQIRDVPDDVHATLARAAAAHGQSLTKYLAAELEHLAGREQVLRHNAAVVRTTQSRVRGRVGRDTILATLREVRGE